MTTPLRDVLPQQARSARLVGLGSWLPPRQVTNAELCARLDTSDEWIRTRIGIATRHVADPATATSDMAVEAGMRAMKSAGVEHVDAVVLATATPDHPVPGTAPAVAHRLGLGHVPAFDVGAGCSGFVYATTVASALIRAGTARSILVVGAETMSAIVDPADRTTAPIFGDGAGAVVLREARAGEPGTFGPVAWGSAGEHAAAICIPEGGSRRPSHAGDAPRGYVHMEGNLVLRHAVRQMAHAVRDAAAAAGWDLRDIDRLIVHQANARISAGVADALGLPAERVPSNITDVGNTSAASIPLLLASAAAEGRLTAGQRVMVAAFGAGFTWAATTLVWPADLRPLT
ncbi:beta-ketoacyl-ACP synthase III [Actinacidiphila paucisporea]|uniref:Beta-ketoacyl-[acyl-carrier-protein] synthase III n=1 Tax=Actinacidiphila paucisporea TaxID=310782 RepID=A0A1M7I913_9ACTN|nr:beta-ketoacyl-ACP synthase III [Actinacidiphila paucisporea]SHM37306.1 3-oxoacyl-[acyl-carrier-protein] synthase III [Actinacidiphila paucisporea]